MQTIFDEVLEVEVPEKSQTKAFSGAKELASKFHEIHQQGSSKNNEPDWDGMALRAATQQERWKIRDAQEAYELDKKTKAWEAQKRDQEDEVNKILALPTHHRNKAFYDNLQKTNGRFYFDERISKQRRLDQQVLGLSYHLRRKS